LIGGTPESRRQEQRKGGRRSLTLKAQSTKKRGNKGEPKRAPLASKKKKGLREKVIFGMVEGK